MCQGWVYVAVNSSLPGLAKVGRTTRPPPARVAELSSATGVPTPFVLAFDHEFADCEQAERDVHAELDRRGYRLAANREFFRGEPREIIHVVLHAAAMAGDAPPTPALPSAEALLAQGDRHLFGDAETLQDPAEARNCYRLAAARGSLIAVERLGALYAAVRGKSRAGKRRALKQLKAGAARGNYYCYVELATLFASDGHLPNMLKAWDLFFARRADSFLADVEGSETRYVLALRRYMFLCLEHGLVPAHLDELRAQAEPMIRSLLMSLDEVRDAPELRQRLSMALRWANETLMPRRPALAPPARQQGWRGLLRRALGATA